ncbi:MAG: hypothetical protein PW792_12730 [Acidobacteriaceae bacterium]|nr:hypothetical protein [Acidobacteriaceae bacterium]
MALLEFLANAFISTFGITQPTEKTRRHASYFILALLALALVAVGIVGTLFYHVLHS